MPREKGIAEYEASGNACEHQKRNRGIHVTSHNIYYVKLRVFLFGLPLQASAASPACPPSAWRSFSVLSPRARKALRWSWPSHIVRLGEARGQLLLVCSIGGAVILRALALPGPFFVAVCGPLAVEFVTRQFAGERVIDVIGINVDFQHIILERG